MAPLSCSLRSMTMTKAYAGFSYGKNPIRRELRRPSVPTCAVPVFAARLYASVCSVLAVPSTIVFLIPTRTIAKLSSAIASRTFFDCLLFSKCGSRSMPPFAIAAVARASWSGVT